MEFLNTFSNLSVFEISLLAIFGVIWLIRFLYLFIFTARIAFKRNNKTGRSELNPISVLLTFRNEEENIKRVIPEILELPNENFELVAVDDFSQDNSLSLLGLYRQQFNRLRISSLSQETKYSEKLAQNIGLKSAEKNWVLIAPVTMQNARKEWLSYFQAEVDTNKNLIVGYTNILAQKVWYNRLMRVELALQFIKSTAYTSNGIGMLYSEDNVAFKREEYFKLGGFGRYVKEPYANLELLINSFIKKRTTSFGLDVNAKLIKTIENNRSSYLNILKKAWRIENHLSFWKRFFLTFEEITELLFLPITVSALLVMLALWPVFAVLIGVMLVARMLIIKITLNRLNERKIFITSLVYGLIMPYYKVFARWKFNKTKRRHKWKNKV